MSDEATTTNGLFDRTLSRIGRAFRGVAGSARLMLGAGYRPDLPEDDAARLAQQIDLCLEERGGEVSARARAAALGRTYLELSPLGRERFLHLLAERQNIDRRGLEEVVERWQAAADDDEARLVLEAEMRQLLVAPTIRLLRQFNDLPEGVKFLVDLRAELQRLARLQPRLASLDAQLRDLLATWFDIGFLNLERITWNAPAALLEKLIDYEAVHTIRSWADLKNRLDSDRRCFAFFHPRMPNEPLIFVEVALVDGMAGSIQALLDEHQPVSDPRKADTAIFYSISNCQKGLAGVSFGNFLIKRVVEVLARDLPNIKAFATLSPIPGFRGWLDTRLAAAGEAAVLTPGELATLAGAGDGGQPIALAELLERPGWPEDPLLSEAARAPLMRLCAEYLLVEKRGRTALDRVAHFHLSNGARVERLNWLGDTSENGLRLSAGIMVNYRYLADEIEANHEAYRGEGQINAHNAVRRLLRG